MPIFVLTLLIVVSIGLGFALKWKAPQCHLAMWLLISFLIVLILFIVTAKALGKLGS